ncbi:MAG TPA: ABC transporter ATP-binding protein [Streptosporangiaceae bacterium]|jgi:energy-coupling factor transport system ATP-binding protein
MAATEAADGPVGAELRGWGWRHAGREMWALRGVDLTVAPGERVLLLGPSGAGKSTLLHALAGLTGDDASLTGDEEGTLLVGGRPARDARGRTGLVAQDPETQIVMARAGDDVAFGLENRGLGAAEIWPRVDTALSGAGFPYGRGRATAALSGGEKQRLVIAGTLALRPGLLLLDEPTANLDPAGAALVRDVLAGLGGVTMILVEHRVADVVDLVDRVVVVEPGAGVVADGAPGEVFARRGADLAARGVWVPGREPSPAVTAAVPGPPVISARGCGVRAPGGPGTAEAPDPVRHVDADLADAAVTALTGPNGAGKSTLLMLLAGLARPDRGEVVPAGRLAEADPRPLHRWPARLLARHLGTVFQHAESQFVTARVRDELRFGPLRTGTGHRAADARADDLLARLRLDHLADAHPFTLSGGEKRRLSVATALATAPDVLLLDEPTFGQDARTWSELVALLAGLRDSGHAIAVATHDERLLAALADRVLPMAAGALATEAVR